jgi:hypothetical protein
MTDFGEAGGLVAPACHSLLAPKTVQKPVLPGILASPLRRSIAAKSMIRRKK